jgi:dihydroorotate dehydrogenase
LKRPVLVKVAPDLSFEALDELLEVIGARGVDGIVATNTFPNSEFRIPNSERGTGGVSGRPLRKRSTEVIRHVHRQTEGKLPIIGVGGVFSAEDAWEKIIAGASLVQLYTGLVYGGPGVAKEIVTGLAERMGRGGLKNIEEAVGTEKSSGQGTG